jgi:hypothetical protein
LCYNYCNNQTPLKSKLKNINFNFFEKSNSNETHKKDPGTQIFELRVKLHTARKEYEEGQLNKIGYILKYAAKPKDSTTLLIASYDYKSFVQTLSDPKLKRLFEDEGIQVPELPTKQI